MTSLDALADQAFAPVAAALAAARIPGASLGLVRADGARATRHAGHASLDAMPDPVRADTLFDLASLTKVLHTTPAILRLVERGLADLDDPLSAHLPDLHQVQPAHFVRALTLRDCLAHRTALPAHEPIYTWAADPSTLRALVLQRDWPAGPPVYSDINFILLGLLADRLAPAEIPPGFAASPGPERAAATEHCHWRGRTLRGEVHDENAAALGGLAGHAGLFGTADAVLDSALAILQGTWLSPASLDLMARPQRALPTPRGLGWELPHDGWSGGSLCSPGTIGHLGFTGTGLWIDRPRGLAWTLLTNRVHPSRHRETGIASLRRAVSNIVSAGAK